MNGQKIRVETQRFDNKTIQKPQLNVRGSVRDSNMCSPLGVRDTSFCEFVYPPCLYKRTDRKQVGYWTQRPSEKREPCRSNPPCSILCDQTSTGPAIRTTLTSKSLVVELTPIFFLPLKRTDEDVAVCREVVAVAAWMSFHIPPTWN